MSDIEETHHGVVHKRKTPDRNGDKTASTLATVSLAITKAAKPVALRGNENANVLQTFYVGRHHTSDVVPQVDDVFEVGPKERYVVTESDPYVPVHDGWDTGHKTRLKRTS